MRGRKNISLLLAVALLLGVALSTSGCGVTKSLTSLKDRFAGKDSTPVVEVPPPENQLPVSHQGFSGETIKVTLYFADSTGSYLVPEERNIPKVVGLARATIQELINGPMPGSGLLPTIPAGVVLKDINIKPDGLAIVDFNKQLMLNHPGGSTAEKLTVYSIVNTLTKFPTVDRVQFLVEGQYVKTIAGHVDVSTVMGRNESLIKRAN